MLKFFKKIGVAANLITITLSFVALFIAAALVAFAGWSEPTKGVNDASLSASLNRGAIDQEKLGGLAINLNGASGENLFGLVVFGKPRTGFVGIGTANPAERLDIVGDLLIEGLIKPDGQPGSSVNELLTISSPSKISWQPDTAWLAIPKINIHTSPGNCIPVFPACSQIGSDWSQFGDPVGQFSGCGPPPPLGGPPFTYGGELRICYKNFK